MAKQKKTSSKKKHTKLLNQKKKKRRDAIAKTKERLSEIGSMNVDL